MRRILAGIETEYGLLVEGRGAEDQVDEAMALVRSYPGERFSVWDYRHESPRADLRGFQVDRLSVDPVDLQFDEGRDQSRPQDVRSDQILTNGARFYNDHGHPEYATPECWTLAELAERDREGERLVWETAQTYARKTDRTVKIYKNNTDFHGASYGTHESYLVPRSLGVKALANAVLPMLVVRPLLTGAGKVGSESGAWTDFQLSQRADFFSEVMSADTLYRRPIFNTRDEPHADPEKWIRLHVISGDANMMPSCTRRKVALVKLAIALAEVGAAPIWEIRNPVRAIQDVSRDLAFQPKIELAGRSWTNPTEILESYFAAADRLLDLDEELRFEIKSSRDILQTLGTGNWRGVADRVDWAAKRSLLEDANQEGVDWKDAMMRAYDLEYHNVDPDEGLFHALESMGQVQADPEFDHGYSSRAFVRGLAIERFGRSIHAVCWRSITFRLNDRLIEVELMPDVEYPRDLESIQDVESFIETVRGKNE
jgi:proteasome accessory factor A